MSFGFIAYVWIWTDKLNAAPWWGPLAAIVANALPGGMVADLAKTLGLALVDKLPGRSAGK